MTEYRASYQKTVVIAAVGSIGGIITLIWLVSEGLAPRGLWSLLGGWPWLAACFVLFCGEAVGVLVVVGGLICLHRDSLENRGLPYVARRPREWHGGFVIRGIRTAVRALSLLRGRRPGQLDLRPGELVKIRSQDEILATLEDRGVRDSLPFTPEMAALCGCQARVFRRVDKVYDWILSTGLRRMRDTVILEGLRCDGRQHGGCQAGCQMLWKEVWLERLSTYQKRPPIWEKGSPSRLDLHQFTQRVDAATSEQRFVCQMTQLPEATTLIPRNDRRHYLWDLQNGNLRPGPFLVGVAILLFNLVQRRCRGVAFPYRAPIKLLNTPHVVLDLQPGELVRVKNKREIEATLDANYKNRGLWFDPEMIRFCGGVYHVLARVNRQIEEKSGKMITIANPCIILEDVTASSEYHAFSPLSERIYWHEIWLERVIADLANDSPPTARQERPRP